MTNQTWACCLKYLEITCVLREQKEDYAMVMFAELRDAFSDAEAARAAQLIAQNEQLFGNYPSLILWLKYCPARAPRLENITRAQFLERVEFYLDPDSPCFADYQPAQTRREQLALRAAGELSGLYALANGNYGNRTSALKKLGEIYDSLSSDDLATERLAIIKSGGTTRLGDVLRQITKGGA